MANGATERSPLLQNPQDEDTRQVVDFAKWDEDNPRTWSRTTKLTNVAIIALMAILSPLASSMFTPGIKQIADSLHTDKTAVVGATTSFVVFLGIGPLVLAPLSEVFGRRKLYLVSFSVFSLVQIPTALSPNVATLIALRTVSGFCGSVGIANGGGTISDMYHPKERARIFGWYLLGPVMGPTLGPLFGGLVVENLGWRWVFWILAIVCSFNTMLGFLFLKETYAPVILEARKSHLEKAHADDSTGYRLPHEDPRPFRIRLASSLVRPLKILFTQPIVLVMAVYQAFLFGTNYSLYTNFEVIYGAGGYGFTTTQVGLMYLGTGVGFLTAVIFIIPWIDTIFNTLTARNDDTPKPEFRLPLANIGSVLIPLSLFGFAWTVQAHAYWLVPVICTSFFTLGQLTTFNTVQNYYIDAFSKYAASAIAAGTLFRSVIGGALPLVAPKLFMAAGYGWGFSVFAFLNLLMAPFPALCFYYGEGVREKHAIDL